MAYADLKFYAESYFGNLLIAETFPRYAERASDWLDTVTFKRLVNGLPSDDWNAKRVQKCVCVLADIFYQIDEAQKNANASASGSVGGSDEQCRTVKSFSAGSESITYMTPAELASGAKEWSAVYAVAGDKAKTMKLLMQTAGEYLNGVTDDNGTNLLYAGV